MLRYFPGQACDPYLEQWAFSRELVVQCSTVYTLLLLNYKQLLQEKSADNDQAWEKPKMMMISIISLLPLGSSKMPSGSSKSSNRIKMNWPPVLIHSLPFYFLFFFRNPFFFTISPKKLHLDCSEIIHFIFFLYVTLSMPSGKNVEYLSNHNVIFWVKWWYKWVLLKKNKL